MEGKYKSGWMGERSVPMTWAEGYCCAVEVSILRKSGAVSIVTEFNSPDSRSGSDIEDALWVVDNGSQM